MRSALHFACKTRRIESSLATGAQARGRRFSNVVSGFTRVALLPRNQGRNVDQPQPFGEPLVDSLPGGIKRRVRTINRYASAQQIEQ